MSKAYKLPIGVATAAFVALGFPLSLHSKDISHEALMNVSHALADQMGKTYQMTLNCDLQASSVDAAHAAGLFINYMSEDQVQEVIDEYAQGMQRVEKDRCDKDQLARTFETLMESISNYIRLAQPHMKPY